jgi:nucleoside-diphosphate-sugar epimerase
MSRVLIFGAGGYLGIPLCESLAARGHEVWPVDRWFFGKYPNLPTPPVIGDIRTVRAPLFAGIDAVVDLCGLSNDLSAEIDPELTRSINIEGGKRLATLARNAGVKRYVYSSSASVYGAGDRPNLTETNACKPLTLYARSKVEVEDHLRSIAGGGFEPVILRNATVFGVAPRMRFDLAVNVMTLRAWRDGVIYVMGGGEQWRPFIHVDDVVRAFVWGVEDDNVASETFNVGTSNHTIAEVAKKVAHEFPMARIMPIPDDPDKRSYSCSYRKISEAIDDGYNLKSVTIDVEIDRMSKMLRDGTLKDDPTCHTLQWYKSLMEWDKRLADIRLDGRIL